MFLGEIPEQLWKVKFMGFQGVLEMAASLIKFIQNDRLEALGAPERLRKVRC